jgi:hypothetical protein
MSGNHRPAGVLFLSKPTVCGAARLEDVAPTVLAELEVAGPPMDGTSVLGEYADTLRGGESDRGIGPVGMAGRTAVDREALVEQRLRDLGYFE